MYIAMFQLHTASLHQAMRSTGYVNPYKPLYSAVIGWFSTAVISAFRSSLFQWVVFSAVRFFAALRLLCFLIVGIQASGISIPLSLLMLWGWSLMWITSLTLCVYQCGSQSINFTSSKVDSVRCCGCALKRRGLGTGESDVSVMLLYPVFHWSSSLADVNFVTFTGNSVNNAVLLSRVSLSIVSDLKTVHTPCCCCFNILLGIFLYCFLVYFSMKICPKILAKILQNRPLSPQICLFKFREISLFSRELSEALISTISILLLYLFLVF